MPTSLILADDHAIVREGLRSLFREHPDFDVLGEAGDGNAAVLLARTMRPDIVLMDVSMPDLSGIEATRQILEFSPGTRIIALSMHAEVQYVARMFEAGAAGYLLKKDIFEDIVKAVRTVMAGRIYLDSKITGVVVQDYARRLVARAEPRGADLTGREREVLKLLADGLSNKEVALALHVSVKTVESHRKHLVDKLGIQSVAGLTKFAISEGLVSLDS